MSGDLSVEAAIAALARGEIVVLQDDDGVGHLVRDARGTSGEDVVAMVSDGGIFSLVLAASAAARSCGSVSERCMSSPSSSVMVFDIRDILSFSKVVLTADPPVLTVARVLLDSSVHGNKIAAI